jgi:hypothetical protein
LLLYIPDLLLQLVYQTSLPNHRHQCESGPLRTGSPPRIGARKEDKNMLCKNRITLMGFLGQGAETQSTPNGTIYNALLARYERELETKRQRRIQNAHGIASRDQLEQAR